MLLKGWKCFWFLSSFEKIVRLQWYRLVQVVLVMASLFSMLNLAFEEGLGDKLPVFRVCLFLYALVMSSKTQNGNVLEIELLHSWGAPWAFVKLFVGTFCTGSGESVHHFGIMAFLRKEQACTLKPLYLQSVGPMYWSVFHSLIGSLCVRYPLWSVPYRLEGRSSHQWLKPNLDS